MNILYTINVESMHNILLIERVYVVMKKFIRKHGYILGAFAVMASEYAANFCFFVFHQPEIPDSVKRLRKSHKSR